MTPPQDRIDVEGLKAAAEKATPGEWIIYVREGDYGGGVIASVEPGPGVAALSAVCSNVVPHETVAWHEDYAPYTKPDDTFVNIVGDSDLGVGVGDEQTALNFAFIALANPATILELIAQRAALVEAAKSIKSDLEYLMEWGKIKPHEIIEEIDALLSTIQATGGGE